ncbi:uncharacterized protein LOC123924747 isoform X2 [Trifolium pratense]|uniref:uncharacterized protein LOC123882975 n=1 Tax=Trifolium pratense TaxID=57577 RepID=UPI001E694982|nr:uncharacterized protein LOC123882975 [Trifolium pratense]XP_045833670.1 uncharacterized protein LOC123924747 isoform X2 [Trifolium pratense]
MSSSSKSQFNRENYEEIDPDYAEFLEKNGEDYYDRLEDSRLGVQIQNAPNTYAVSFIPLGFADHEIPDVHIFEFTLNHFNHFSKTQITLPNELSKYVRDLNLQTLILEVPGTNTSKVHLRYPTNPSENVHIVGGWKNFCFDNGIQFGDRLRIEFKHVYPNVGKVYKVTT